MRERFVTDTTPGEPQRRIVELLSAEAPLMSAGEVQRRSRLLAIDLVGLGPIQALLEDPAVSDVLVNGPGELWVERAGRLERTGVWIDTDEITRCIERLVGPLGLRADRACPIVDARLPDGTRVAVVLGPLAVDGPVIAVRRHRAVAVPLEAFAGSAVVQLLRSVVAEHLNVVVYGGTGAGKTTLLNALGALLHTDERIVTIEDVAELRFPGDHVVRLEARPGTADGVGRAGIRDLVRAALRLRPDRIVVGEVRGAEALDMLWALTTGHDGSFSTCHASTAADAVRRLETLCVLGGDGLPLEAIRSQLFSAVDVLIGVGRSTTGRRITGVHELGPDGSLRPLVGPDGEVTVGAVASSRSR